MWDSTPWFVKGGIHQSEVARLLAYAALGGAGGVINAADCAVKPLLVPGKGFRVVPGGIAIPNGSASAGSQMYVARNPEDEEVTVADTPSSGSRSDLIIARVEDPQYPGTPEPPDRATAQYIFTRVIEDVPVGTRDVKEIAGHENDSAETLARITRPASTGTVTSGHITDLRRLAMPHTKRELRTYAMVAADNEMLTGATVDGEYWPNHGGEYYMDIPEWATQMQVRVDYSAVYYPPGNVWGYVWMEYGPKTTVHNRTYASQKFRFDSPNVNNNSRANFIVADTLNIPKVMRGTRQLFVTKGRIDGKSANSARPSLTSTGGVVMDITFNEVPVV